MDTIASNHRVYLRKVILQDAPFIYDLLNQRDWLQFIGDRNIRSLGDAKNYIQTGPIQAYQRHGFGLYLVAGKNDDKPLGLCGFLKRSYLSAPDLGFAISEHYHRQGFGYSAASLAMSIASKIVNTTTIYATVNKDNVASYALLEKLGFAPTTAALETLHSDELSNVLLYKISR